MPSKYDYPQFRRGDKVRTMFGETRTVRYQQDCCVYVEQERIGGREWYHPSKLFLIDPDRE